MYLCELCRTEVEPRGKGIVLAWEIKKLNSMSGTEVIDGLGAFFHEACYPRRGYRRVSGEELEAELQKLESGGS